MKSFMIACLLLTVISVCVCLHTHHTTEILEEMTALSQTFAQSEEEFFNEYENMRENVEKLYHLWDEHFSYIAFTVGYSNTNRCDEAIGDLHIYFQNRDAGDFIASLARFHDALSRLRILESLHPESIF